MPQRVRSNIETRSRRLKLPVGPRPVFVTIAPGINLGYRRCVGAGRWICRVADGKGSSWQRAFAAADDHEAANGTDILDYVEAMDKARRLGRGDTEGGGPPGTVATALADYEANLRARGGMIGNVLRLRRHLTPSLAAHPVALLSSHELQRWRNGLLDTMAVASVNRTASVFRAVLNGAAEHDQKLASNAAAWKIGLKAIKRDAVPRNIILADEQVHAIIRAAYAAEGPDFGLWIEVASATGARASQQTRIRVCDLQDDRPEGARLMIPRSGKGKNGIEKKEQRVPVPIGGGLAAKLRRAAGDRGPDEPLLTKADGSPWRTEPNDIRRPFQRAAAAAGVAHATAYSLRHSFVVRALNAGTPLRALAAALDTSTVMLERVYSANIGDVSDALLRRGLLPENTAADDDNIVPLAERRAGSACPGASGAANVTPSAGGSVARQG